MPNEGVGELSVKTVDVTSRAKKLKPSVTPSFRVLGVQTISSFLKIFEIKLVFAFEGH